MRKYVVECSLGTSSAYSDWCKGFQVIKEASASDFGASGADDILLGIAFSFIVMPLFVCG